MSYNPSAPGVKGSIFGLPYQEEDASIVLLPIPWDLTTSYASGASLGPRAVLDASPQLDLELFEIEEAWKTPIWMAPSMPDILKSNDQLRPEVERYLDRLENQPNLAQGFSALVKKVNEASLKLQNYVKETSSNYLNQGKLVAVLGGDHSTSLGLIDALGHHYKNFGILQIDAHMDLRRSYEGFDFSHASIMYNALQLPEVEKLTQVGIRDYCQEELEYVKKEEEKIEVHYDEQLKNELYSGTSWHGLCEKMIKNLPEHVYISFDIDGLNPHLCPGTGTPVPGGLEFQGAIHLIKTVAQSGRKIIGFDLCEVAPKMNDSEWNANVGARVLYNLCCWAAKS